MECGRKQELWEKLRRVRKRGGQRTPVASFWRRNGTEDSGGEHDGGDLSENAPTSEFISSRKLAAALWELHHYDDSVTVTVPIPPPHLRRLKLNHRRSPPPVSPHDMMPENSSDLRGHVANQQSIKKNHLAIPTASPPSYGSSMESALYKPAVSASMNSCLRTSAKLLKVVKQIRRLEEQHVADTSLVKALKKELHRARSQIKELSTEHQADRNQLDQLMKHIAEDKLVRNNKEYERIDELENERRLRLRSESLQRKLTGELREAKTSLASIHKEVEKERKSCDLVKDLCDELALGVREKSKRADHDDCLILHISELWLHEQRKTKLQQCVGEKKSTIDKLGAEIEAFLQSKRKSKGNQDAEQKQITGNSQNGNCEAAKDDVSKQRHDSEGMSGLNSLPESGQMKARIHHRVASSVRRSYSKASSKCVPENDSTAMVPEAKTVNQRPRSHKKASIIPLRDE